MHTIRKTTAAAVVSAAAILVAAAPSGAGPQETGCPSGFDLLSVDDLAAQGYLHAPQRADDGGNGNGFVCGLPLPEGFRHSLEVQGLTVTVPVVYLFTDDGNPSQR